MHNFTGDFIGRVSVSYKVFSVIEGERFEMTCSATHEDKKPDLQWYRLDYSSERTNLTGLRKGSAGRGTDKGLQSSVVFVPVIISHRL